MSKLDEWRYKLDTVDESDEISRCNYGSNFYCDCKAKFFQGLKCTLPCEYQRKTSPDKTT